MGLSVVQAALKLRSLVLTSWVLGLPMCTSVPGTQYALEYLCAAFLEILVAHSLVGYVGAKGFYWDWRMVALSSEGK